MTPEAQPSDISNQTTTGQLARRLSTADAVVVGLGSMIGAGVCSLCLAQRRALQAPAF